MVRSKEKKDGVNSRIIERKGKAVINGSGRVSSNIQIYRSEVNRRCRRGSMLTRERRDKRRKIRKRRRKRQRRKERTKFVRARSRENRIVKRDGNTVSITRSVYISVIAVMRNELMIISERNTYKEIERGFHD